MSGGSKHTDRRAKGKGLPSKWEHIGTSKPEFATWKDYSRKDPRLIRSGVIPYFVDGKREYWVVSRSYWNSLLGDFGGGCEGRDGRIPETCMTRELIEESKGISVADMVGDTLGSRTRTQTLNGEKLTTKILRQTSRRGKRTGTSWLLLVPISASYVDLMRAQTTFKPDRITPEKGKGEITAIEILEFDKLAGLARKTINSLFMHTISDFVFLLASNSEKVVEMPDAVSDRLRVSASPFLPRPRPEESEGAAFVGEEDLSRLRLQQLIMLLSKTGIFVPSSARKGDMVGALAGKTTWPTYLSVLRAEQLRAEARREGLEPGRKTKTQLSTEIVAQKQL